MVIVCRRCQALKDLQFAVKIKIIDLYFRFFSNLFLSSSTLLCNLFSLSFFNFAPHYTLCTACLNIWKFCKWCGFIFHYFQDDHCFFFLTLLSLSFSLSLFYKKQSIGANKNGAWAKWIRLKRWRKNFNFIFHLKIKINKLKSSNCTI